jgi:hypothetical protein
MYEDKTLTCKDCGAEFIFTAGEQEFYAEKASQTSPSAAKPAALPAKTLKEIPRAAVRCTKLPALSAEKPAEFLLSPEMIVPSTAATALQTEDKHKHREKRYAFERTFFDLAFNCKKAGIIRPFYFKIFTLAAAISLTACSDTDCVFFAHSKFRHHGTQQLRLPVQFLAGCRAFFSGRGIGLHH